MHIWKWAFTKKKIAHLGPFSFYLLFYFIFFIFSNKFELIMGMYDAKTNFAYYVYTHSRLNSFKLDA